MCIVHRRSGRDEGDWQFEVKLGLIQNLNPKIFIKTENKRNKLSLTKQKLV